MIYLTITISAFIGYIIGVKLAYRDVNKILQEDYEQWKCKKRTKIK